MSLTAAPPRVTEERPDPFHHVLVALTAAGAGITAASLYAVAGRSDVSYVLPLILGFPVTMLLGFGASVRSMLRGGVVTAEPVGWTAPTEVPGWTLARVEAIRRTGISMNDQPLCDLDLVVADDSERGGYRTTLRTVVDLVDVPRRQPGCVLVVRREDAERPEVVVVANPAADAAAAAAAELTTPPGEGRVPTPHGLPVQQSTPAPLLTFSGPSPIRTAAVSAWFAVGAAVALLLPQVLR